MESTESVNLKKDNHQEQQDISPSPSLSSPASLTNEEENEIIETNKETSSNIDKENQEENEKEEEVKESQDPFKMESRDSCNEQSSTLSCHDEEVVQVASTDSIEVDMNGLSSNSILDSNLNLEHRLQETADEVTDSPSNTPALDDTNHAVVDESIADKQDNETNDDDDNISYEEEEEIEESKEISNDVSTTPTANETVTTISQSTAKIIDAIPSSPPASPPSEQKYESPIKASTSNDTHTSTISAHMEIHSLKEFYEKKLHLQKQTHDQQIDEILQQLNHLESTYEEQLVELRESVTKTNIMNEALMNQLVVYKTKLEEESQLVETTKTQVKELQTSIEEMETMHESQLLNLKTSKEDAIIQAREEIRLAAESQFAAAQKTFLKLKQDYISLKTEKQDVEKKYTITRDKLLQLEKKDQNYSQEMNKVLAENAELQAKLATDNAETLKLKQSYLEKANSFVQKEQNLEERLEVLEKERKDAVRAYSVVAEEKEALKNENAELQALCEELMLIVEGNKGK
ncbi:predicted protein [Chaetoceros tenuissimus]|uniref:Uncharacterized protein n=1 Tax=Chaetoceros tenuissimus TaxID=426638 RepID=A0AAD3H2T6_9STRA|nr:predicted protein [Chaetoceros tenuissimus]